MSVIEIRFKEDLGSKKKNELRVRMEIAELKKAWYEAQMNFDVLGIYILLWRLWYDIKR